MHVKLGRLKLNDYSYRMMSNIVCGLLLLAIAASSSNLFAQQGSVTSKLSASTVTRDESVTLEVVAIGLDAELDTSSLNKDFDVVGRSSSREVNTVMDVNQGLITTSVVTWALQLLPKDVGIFTVPPVKVGNLSSQAHTLTVNEIPTGAQRDVFLEASIDTTTPWVQSQVLMTLKVYQGLDIVDGRLGSPSAENLLVERLGDDVQTKEILDGREYDVTTRRFALLPQKSGEMVIDPITLGISILADPSRSRGFFAPTRKLTRRTDSITLNVKPRPESGSAWWLPAKAVQLTGSWIGDVDSAQVDTPLTRSIVLRARGVSDSQLPDIEFPDVEGASIYAEQPERILGANQQGLVSELALKWAVIPQRPGELLLPALTVEWFNTNTGSVETAVLPEERILVAASQSQTSVAPTATQLTSELPDTGNRLSNDNSVTQDKLNSASAEGNALNQSQFLELQSNVALWQRLTMAALVLWMATIAYFVWISRRRSQNRENSTGSSLGAVRNASRNVMDRMQPLGVIVASCKQGDIKLVADSLIDWAQKQWPSDAPQTLSALEKRLPVGQAKETVRLIDAALYSQDATAPSSLGSEHLKALPEHLKSALDDPEYRDSAGPDSKHDPSKLPVL